MQDLKKAIQKDYEILEKALEFTDDLNERKKILEDYFKLFSFSWLYGEKKEYEALYNFYKLQHKYDRDSFAITPEATYEQSFKPEFKIDYSFATSLINFDVKEYEKNLKQSYLSHDEMIEIVQYYLSKKEKETLKIFQNLLDNKHLFYQNLNFKGGATMFFSRQDISPYVFLQKKNLLVNSYILVHELAHILDSQKRDEKNIFNSNTAEVYPRIQEKKFIDFAKKKKLFNNEQLEAIHKYDNYRFLASVAIFYSYENKTEDISIDNLNITQRSLIASLVYLNKQRFSKHEVNQFFKTKSNNLNDYLNVFNLDKDNLFNQKNWLNILGRNMTSNIIKHFADTGEEDGKFIWQHK